MNTIECAHIASWLSEIKVPAEEQPKSRCLVPTEAPQLPSPSPFLPTPPLRSGSNPPLPASSSACQSPTQSSLLRKHKRQSPRPEFESFKRSCPTQLTRQALREFNSRKPGGNSSTPVKNADAAKFQTPSKGSDKRSEPKLPENMHTIRQSLAQHMMRINDKEAYNRYPAFKELVDDIFSKERGSRLSAGSAKAIKHTYDLNYTQNEKTFFAALRHMIIKSDRSVLSNKHDLEGLEKWMIKSFEDDGLMIIEDCRLVTKHIPNKTYSKSDQHLGMTEPVPDVAIGSQEPRFPQPGPQPGEYLKSLKNVAPGMDWAFLAMEHKSAAEGIVLAENQAIRDGAVLVNSQLKLNTILADPKESRPAGADKNAFAFSCAWVPDMARIFVHWVETTEEGYTIFHMNQIFELMMTREQEMGDMRAACHTIIDWGLSTFKTAKEETFGKILAQGKGNAKSATRSTVGGALSLEDFKG